VERFIKGDIVVVPFPFSNLYSSKKRPALVLADSGGDDVILCRITSQNVKDDLAIMVELSDVENGSLNTISNVRPNKLFTADKNIISYKIGNLTAVKMEKVIESVVDVFTK